MPNILLVEDDEYFREALNQILTAKGHKVTEAEDGRMAKSIIKAAPPFDLVISDIQMPHLTGVELLQWVKENKPTPFLLMTGFALIMETKKAHDLGADEFLAKPFDEKELKEVLDRVFKPIQTKANDAAPAAIEYYKLSLSEFVSSPIIRFDVYVKLGSRYLKIGHKGDSVPKDRIENYKAKGLKFLHVKKEDYSQIVDFNLKVANAMKNNDKIDKGKKNAFIRYTGEVILEKVFMNGVNKEEFNEAKDFVSNSLNLIAEQQEAYELLNVLNSHTDYIYAHSLACSTYATMIAKCMGLESAQILFKVSMAGLFHDIGKKEISRDILEKPRALLSQQERDLIETHPARGKEILLSLKTISSDIVQMVFEHHENILGTGFPRQLDKMRLHPLSHIIKVANTFVEYALKGPHHAGMTANEAISYIQKHFGDELEPQALAALIKIFSAGEQRNAAA